MSTLIAPSILSADFANLGAALIALQEASCDWIRVDVMDGHFVPNLTIGPPVIQDLKKRSSLPLDVHLMITNPELYITDYVKAGANHITVHAEACIHLHAVIQQIKKHNIKAGVAINPATNPNVLRYVLNDLDLILVMSVNPGFGGQDFIHSSLEKIKHLRTMLKESNNEQVLISVDGGINNHTAALAVKAGANVLVSGSYLFKAVDLSHAIKTLKNSEQTSLN